MNMSSGEEKANRAMTDNYANPVTNEGNLLSLITLKQILGDGDGEGQKEVQDIVHGMAKEETRYLLQAMKILGGKLEDTSGQAGMATMKLREKYGRDMNSALKLASVLKAKSDEKEVELMLNPFVMDTLRNGSAERSTRGGFTIGVAGQPSAYAGTTLDSARSNLKLFE